MYIPPTNEHKKIMKDREETLSKEYGYKVSPQDPAGMQILMNDPVWAYANQKSGDMTDDETKGHLGAAETGPELMRGVSFGRGGPSTYGAVGMNPELFAQRRLEEDEEKMYGRTGLFGMTPYGWA